MGLAWKRRNDVQAFSKLHQALVAVSSTMYLASSTPVILTNPLKLRYFLGKADLSDSKKLLGFFVEPLVQGCKTIYICDIVTDTLKERTVTSEALARVSTHGFL
jgi:hypothetical protein